MFTLFSLFCNDTTITHSYNCVDAVTSQKGHTKNGGILLSSKLVISHVVVSLKVQA